MKVDEVKQTDRLRGVIDLALRSVPDLRRNAETVDPVRPGGLPALLRRTRERLDWRRLPIIRPPASRPKNIIGGILKQFAVFVLLPTALAAAYFYVLASDQYITTAQFAVRGNVEPMDESAGGGAGSPVGGNTAGLIQKHNSQDSFIVKDYIQSQTLVSAVEKALHVSKMFSRREVDFWERYDPDQPVEELVKYWRKHVSARIEVISGIITLYVRAFTPEDALAIAKDVVARSETLINDISRRAQADMLAHAETEATKAQERLRKAHVALQTFRNRWGIIDPLKTAETTLTTIAAMRKDRYKAESDLIVLRGSNLDEKSRSVQNLVSLISALDQQIKKLTDQLTTDGANGADAANNMTRALLEYEELQIERTIATKLNESANLIVDRARVAAGKQQIFLATFVEPALPDDSLYPMRGRAILVVFFCCLVGWTSIALIIAGINDQRL
ncbi:capsule biosynthesis protein [Methylobacterium sp. J-068]|uniref:capsule biosynthesis protein n=1 Tax=Methylobacterium sp. J-068 TaxID=2836649 RepID=UPI001FB9DC75|nr:capsule biosynthesis protein [Methylobacterium sp. J-068]MCJ2037235.1 capsule biosynthesis protein [Methylobacterium sp. J-068]